MKKKERKYESIQWVIDALSNPVPPKNYNDNHKIDAIKEMKLFHGVLSVKENGIFLKVVSGVLTI